MGRAVKGTVLGLALALLLAPAAHAYVFWANKYQDAIGRADLDGNNADKSFIPLPANSHPVGVALDGARVYWSNVYSYSNSQLPDSIGRANFDGTDVRSSFITGAAYPVAVAVDGAHVYWTNAHADTIGRASLDGSGVSQRFITGANRPYGLAVDGGHAYWTNLNSGKIGRANLDGTCPDQSFISAAAAPSATDAGLAALAVDAAHIYWTDYGDEAIGRANLDGTGVIRRFIPLGGQLPWGLAVDAAHLYWSNQMPRSIGRADLDGQNVQQSFIGAAGEGIYGVAVGPASTTQTARTACPQPDRLAPQLSGLTLSRHVFAAASRGAGIARRRSRIRVGTQLRYTLSEDAAVRFTIKRRGVGRLVHGKCSRRTRRNRARRKCTLGLRGAITVRGARGLNRVGFRGRLRGRKLRPGRYVLVAFATDRAGNRSRSAAVKFRIRRR